jgi:hypothetical protein
MYGVNPPLFPEFVWHEYFWVTSVMLPAWQGFQVRNGPYGSVSSAEPSDGLVHIIYAPEGRDDSRLNQYEINSVKWMIDHEKSIHDVLLQKLFTHYPAIREEVSEWYDEAETAQLVPEMHCAEDLKKLVGIVSVNVHPLVKDGVPFIGIELGCTWDDEHGAGVILHGDHILEYGGADTAIYLWVAQQYVRQ